MGIDLQIPDNFHGTMRSWVKCARCSERLARPYPVESMALEGAEDAGALSRRYRLIVRVGCHGQTMRVAVNVPTYWGQGMILQSLAYVYAFARGGDHAEVRRGTRGQSPGILTTEVR